MRVTALLQRAALRPARLLLAGGDVSKLEKAAVRLAECEPTRISVGSLRNGKGERYFLLKAAVRLAEAGIEGIQVVGAGSLHPEGHPRLDSVALLLRSRAPNRVRDGIHALDLASDPVRFAAGLLALGDVDAVVAGPGVSYQDLTEAVDWTLGAPLDGGPVHSATWLLCTDGSLVGFADCEIQGEGAPHAQARLARAVAHIHARLSEAPARVSFLTGPPWRTENRAAADAVERLKDIDPSIMAEADPAARFRGRPDVLIFSGGTAGTWRPGRFARWPVRSSWGRFSWARRGPWPVWRKSPKRMSWSGRPPWPSSQPARQRPEGGDGMGFTKRSNASGVSILEIDGQLIVGNRQELKTLVQDGLDRGERKFLIDCSRTGYIDSSGLGALVTLSKKVREANGDLRIAGLNEDLRALFELTKLDTLFHIAPSAEEALAGF